MKKTFLFLPFLLFLGGCFDTVTGTLLVSTPITFKNSDGPSFSLGKGSYESSINYRSEDHEIKLKVKNGQAESKATIKVASDVIFPEGEGTVYIKPDQIGQEWGLAQEIKKNSTKTGRRVEIVTCSRFPSGPRDGHQQVTYHYDIEQTFLRSIMIDKVDGGDLAEFNGENSVAYKVIDDTTICSR